MKAPRLLLLVIAVLMLQACSIERRMHRPGLHIDVRNGNQASRSVIHDAKSRPEPMEAVASISPRSLPQLTENEIIRSLNPISTQKRNDPDTCDVIVLKNGEMRFGQSLSITLNDLVFIDCRTGSRSEISLKNVRRIEYLDKRGREIKAAEALVPRSEKLRLRVLSDYAIPGMTLAIGALAAAFSMVLIVSLLNSNPLGILIASILLALTGIAGLVLSIITLREVRRSPMEKKGKPMAVVGLILSLVGMVFWTVVISLFGSKL